MMRNVHAWLIADIMKHADQQVMKDVHDEVLKRRATASTTPGTRADKIRIVFTKFSGDRFSAGALMVLTRSGDGSVIAEATKLKNLVQSATQ